MLLILLVFHSNLIVNDPLGLPSPTRMHISVVEDHDDKGTGKQVEIHRLCQGRDLEARSGPASR